jgi:hypothetical protein
MSSKSFNAMKNSTRSVKNKSVRKYSVPAKRPLHRRISLHPITILFLLCVGVLMIVTTFKAFGATTQLSMSITASPLEEPATITKPADQERFNLADIVVAGTCPTDSYVKIYKNEAFSGVAPCESNKYEFTITLAKGANLLRVRAFNFSDQEGPASGSITVYYDAPVTAMSPSQPKPMPQTDQLRILTDFKYKVHQSGHPGLLDLALAGGVAPYAVAIYWNDGKITPISRTDRSSFTPEHAYAEKPRMYTYVIKIAASDTDGNSDYIQLMAVIDGEKPAESTGTAAPVSAGRDNSEGTRTLLKYMWPAYLIVMLMVLSFYLGEREERRILSRKNQKPMFR